MRRGKPYLKYNLSDSFKDITGLNKGSLEIEWGQPYDMIGPTNWYHCMIRNEMVKNEKDNFFRRSFVIFYIFSFK
ncbi:hypothetical protein [Fusobacterium polymorphum]|jgi:hypothetical protein|uniref:hypothetical protein n=1 Tax=Fusobacterium nucleatum subsp. polymorphum TaxID=76857 RepID=UPI00300B89B9